MVTKNDGAEHQGLMRRVPSRGQKHRNLLKSLRSKRGYAQRIFSGEADLITFGMTFLLVATIVLAMAVGILMGYGAIAGILWFFQHNRTEHAHPTLAHSTTGD